MISPRLPSVKKELTERSVFPIRNKLYIYMICKRLRFSQLRAFTPTPFSRRKFRRGDFGDLERQGTNDLHHQQEVEKTGLVLEHFGIALDELVCQPMEVTDHHHNLLDLDHWNLGVLQWLMPPRQLLDLRNFDLQNLDLGNHQFQNQPHKTPHDLTDLRYRP